MPPRSESAAPRRRLRQTTPGPSNAEIRNQLDFICNVLGVLVLATNEKMPCNLTHAIAERCGIHLLDLDEGSMH